MSNYQSQKVRDGDEQLREGWAKALKPEGQIQLMGVVRPAVQQETPVTTTPSVSSSATSKE